MKFAIAEIGAQLVSPRTRSPTSISGGESRSESKVSQTGKSSEIFCTMQRATVSTAAPPMTYLSGRSSLAMPTSFEENEAKVLTTSFHFRTSAVRPPANHQAGGGPHHPAERVAEGLGDDDSPLVENAGRDEPGDHHPDAHRERDAQADQHP